MKFATHLLFAVGATAFPTKIMEEALKRDPDAFTKAVESIDFHLLTKRQGSGAGAASALFEPVPHFDAQAQFINVGAGSGHEWQAPRASDSRGPCPGLNAFSNHGFLPRNGVATIQQYIDATTTVVGMGPVLAAFLAVLGATLDGDLTSWSMGGPPAVGSLLGGNGLIGSHNKYEADASPTRPDLYQYGNNWQVRLEQFQDMIDQSPGSLTMDSLNDFRSYRFDQSIQQNPYFFNGPFSGVAVQPAAYTFIYRFMANHSAADPIGYLSHETVACWFGVEGTSGNYKLVNGKTGNERIPTNWYRRAQAYPYEVTYFIADLLNAARIYPKFVNIGGNTKGVNTFTGVDIDNLSGGLINLGNLLEGNNLGCFVFQLAAQAKPDILLGLLNPITDALGKLVGQLACPQLRAVDEAQLEQFPGYKRAAVYS